ncbi:terpenoid synthase [Dentipellis sp. KUC8613]|nr:terpenoid synthase [Dentipellis sp. KUC8613]
MIAHSALRRCGPYVQLNRGPKGLEFNTLPLADFLAMQTILSSLVRAAGSLYIGDHPQWRSADPSHDDDHNSDSPSCGKLLSRPEVAMLMRSYLDRLQIPYPTPSDQSAFEQTCVEICFERGYMTPTDQSLRPFLSVGAAMACNGFLHLPSIPARQFICFVSAFMLLSEDRLKEDIDAIRAFSECFTRNEPQKHPMLDHLAALVHQLPEIFDQVAASIMTTSVLNFITAIALEHELEGTALEKSAVRYPIFARVMTGAGEMFALWVFGVQGLPLGAYLQAVPDIVDFINYGNDILSFYKEEMAGETVNLVHTLARCRGVPHAAVLRSLIDDAVTAHERTLRTLSPHRGAYETYRRFSEGYVAFHVATRRYRLDELELGLQGPVSE